jgi:hypothetical protein
LLYYNKKLAQSSEQNFNSEMRTTTSFSVPLQEFAQISKEFAPHEERIFRARKTSTFSIFQTQSGLWPENEKEKIF